MGQAMKDFIEVFWTLATIGLLFGFFALFWPLMYRFLDWLEGRDW
jgi:hypothetical protein